MVDVSAVLDAAGGVVSGKADPGLAGQGGKTVASFFDVLAARMAPAADAAGTQPGLPLGTLTGKEPEAVLDTLSKAEALPASEAAADPAMLAAMIGQPAAPAGATPAVSSTGPVPPNPGAAVPLSATLPAAAGAGASGQMAAEDTPMESPPASATGLSETAKARGDLVRSPAEVLGKAANPAADAAAKGQALPQSLAANAAVQSALGTPLAREGVVDALAALSASAAAGQSGTPNLAPATVGALTDPAMTRLFDVLPRQIEGRLNVAIEAPFRSPAFASELGEKIVWLAGRHAQFAELSLNPPHLGSLEVRLSLSGGEAVAQFFSANASVRDALENAMPRLRELMAQAGIQLGEALVRDQAFAREDGLRDDRQAAGAAAAQPGTEAVATGMPRRGMGLVDLYV